MADILEKNLDELKEVTDWVAAEFKYLNEFKEKLTALKVTSDPKKEKTLVRELGRSFRYAARSERKLHRHFNRLLKGINELKKILPLSQRSLLERLETSMDIAAKKILRESSFFVGQIKGEIKDLEVQIALLRKNPRNKKAIANLAHLLSDLTKRNQELLKWLASLSTSLERTRQFLEQLNKATQLAA